MFSVIFYLSMNPKKKVSQFCVRACVLAVIYSLEVSMFVVCLCVVETE